MSTTRPQTSLKTGKKIYTNTIFEANFNDPDVLTECNVVDQNLKNFLNNGFTMPILVSQNKLKTFVCKKINQTWVADHIGMKYGLFAGKREKFHLLNFNDFDEVIFVDDCEE